MPTTFPLDTQAQFVGGADDDERTVANGGPGTVYYANERAVSSLLNDGSIASGASKTFRRPTWLATDTSVRVTVEDEALAGETEHIAELAVLSESPINVKYPEYGATGGFGDDNHDAVQAAIDAAEGGEVYFPPGFYRTGRLVIPNGGVTLLGAGSGSPGPEALGGTSLSTIILADNTNESLFVIGAGVRSAHFRDLQLDANRDNQSAGTAHGIEVQANADLAAADECDVRVDRCWVRNARSDNFYLGLYRRAAKLTDSVFYNAGRHGVNFNTSDCTIDRCEVGVNTSSGIEVTSGPTHISGCDIYRNSVGINVEAAGTDESNPVLILNCGIDRSSLQGVRIANHKVTLVGNYINANSRATDSGAANVLVLDYDDVVLVGNVFDGVADDQTNRPSYNIETDGVATCLSVANVHGTDSNNLGSYSDPGQVLLAGESTTIDGELTVDSVVAGGVVKLEQSGSLLGLAVSDVAAPGAGIGRLYFRTTGGKVELVARFPTGAIQQVAIEP